MRVLESTFQQSSHSPTAIPRILEEESRAEQQSSLRDFALAKSWQSTSSKNIKTQKVDSRFFTQAAQSLSTPQGKKAESVFSNQPQAAGFLMKSATNLKTQQDSRIFTQAAQPAHHDSKNCGGAVGALRFLGKVSELGVRAFHKNRNTAALPTQSRIV